MGHGARLLRIADFGLRIWECGFRIADFGLRIWECGFRIADLGMRKLENWLIRKNRKNHRNRRSRQFSSQLAGTKLTNNG
jgi:hypothetical protein